MPTRARLTKATIDKACYEGTSNARLVLWDHDVQGFGLRVYPSGRKAFVLSYRHLGRKRLITIGDYGVFTLDAARSKAKKLLAHVDERDPLAERQKAQRGDTFADLARVYLERHAKARKLTWAKDESQLRRHLLKPWGALKLESIGRADVAALHRRLGQRTPIEANRVLSLLSRMFSLAQRWGMLPDTASNPARGIDRYRETERDRWVTPSELPRLTEAINNEPNQVARWALWLYLLTGARRSELLAARWSDVDIDRKILRLSRTKAGRPHEIPLSAPALSVLDNIPRIEGNPYLLPGSKPAAPLVNIAKPWNRVRRSAGVEDVRLHDLRRTVGSWLAQAGSSLALIGKVLNHSKVSTTAIYARLGQDQAREALESYGTRLLATSGSGTARVVPFSRKSSR